MRLGVVFPQTEITPDPGAVRAYTEATESLGYTHLLTYDHVLGADVTNRPGWRGAYQLSDQFHEPFVLFGYLAAITRSLEFVTGVLILPQRQTVLVAKQATEVDLLSGGRLRLGVGIGWNEVEYQALGENFHNRGARSAEQIEVLKHLFSEESVTFQARWHHIEAAGLNPLPVRRSIPIWLGGSADATLRRAARLADGWFPNMPAGEQAAAAIEHLHQYLRTEGRDPATFGIEARISIGRTRPEEWRAQLEAWRRLGATYLSVNTMGVGLGPQGHIDLIGRFMTEVGAQYVHQTG